MGRKIVLMVCATLLLSGGIFLGLNFLSKKTVASNQNSASSQPKNYVDPYPNDVDRDGISNDEEKKLGLNAKEFDTDGDALSDSDEMSAWKTDPKNVDTDGDGVRDGVEVVKGTDPLKKETKKLGN
jgi:hypothetical protein